MHGRFRSIINRPPHYFPDCQKKKSAAVKGG
jgi:hypothetical protein